MTERASTSAHLRTREDHATELAEDYVEAIAALSDGDGGCRVRDLAAHFGVTHVTVIGAIHRLERDGLVETEPYKPVRLTARGARLARVCRERHETVYSFLLAIGVDPETAAKDAEGIEHHVSKATLERFRRFASERADKSQR
ncbi:MAG: manganese-binding transcriptional regulator MntR [Planctomycetota bacterium]